MVSANRSGEIDNSISVVPSPNRIFHHKQTSDESGRELPAEEKQGLEMKDISGTAQLPPPNGGLQAWLHVAGAFLAYFSTW